MTSEQKFLDLLSRLEVCRNHEEREGVLTEIAPLFGEVHFSHEMWGALAERMTRVRIIGEILGRQN
ncbi:MAG: hypothetical protein WBE47_14760 [Candidatus Acidiferrales bacterium]